jgi:phosphoribosylformimino-5-aminoimidazole carboxamide ribotide isomerase
MGLQRIRSTYKRDACMLVIPAIDLIGGKVVRLVQGDENLAKVYSDDPSAVARTFEEAGAVWLHVVDLDGAFGRPGVNDKAIGDMLESVSIRVELGGGIRSMERIERLLAQGVGRVILGSAAVQDPGLVTESVKRFGKEKIVAGIDVRDGVAAVHGWREKAPVRAVDLARRVESAGVSRTVVTDISSDGMLTGPRLDAAFGIARETGLQVIVSGGISGMHDLEDVRSRAVPGIEGVIVGKAYYEKKIDLKEAINRFQEKCHAR